MKVDTELFKSTLDGAKEYLAKLGDKLPVRMMEQFEALKKRLG